MCCCCWPGLASPLRARGERLLACVAAPAWICKRGSGMVSAGCGEAASLRIWGSCKSLDGCICLHAARRHRICRMRGCPGSPALHSVASVPHGCRMSRPTVNVRLPDETTEKFGCGASAADIMADLAQLGHAGAALKSHDGVRWTGSAIPGPGDYDVVPLPAGASLWVLEVAQ